MNAMKRSVSSSSQADVSGASKRNASAAAEDSSQGTSSPETELSPISESSVEHEYEQNIVNKNEFSNLRFNPKLIMYRFFQLNSEATITSGTIRRLGF